MSQDIKNRAKLTCLKFCRLTREVSIFTIHMGSIKEIAQGQADKIQKGALEPTHFGSKG